MIHHPWRKGLLTTLCMLQAAQAMGQAALSMAGMPGAADAAAALLQQGQAAAMRVAQVRAQKKALEAAKERNEQQKEKRQDDLVNGAAVSANSLPVHTRSEPISLHLFQPHQAEQMLSPSSGGRLVDTRIDKFCDANQIVLPRVQCRIRQALQHRVLRAQ